MSKVLRVEISVLHGQKSYLFPTVFNNILGVLQCCSSNTVAQRDSVVMMSKGD